VFSDIIKANLYRGICLLDDYQDICLEASTNKTPPISRFTNPIFNDIDSIVPVCKGNES